MKKLLQLFALISAINSVHMVPAIHIEAAKEFSEDNLENMPHVFGCIDYVKQADEKLQGLQQFITQKKDVVDRSKFASRSDYNRFNKSVKLHIKAVVEEVESLLKKAAKEAGSAL